MNPIELLESTIKREVSSASTSLHRPRASGGSWWLDARNGEHAVRVEWAPRRGFGVSASAPDDDTYGEGPDEAFESPQSAAARAIELLRTRTHTLPTRDVLLGDLRAMIGMTQEQLAQRLGVRQAAVSRLERRGDITLSSLQRFVAALGAELEIRVRTSTGERVRLFTPEASKSHRAACPHVATTTARDGTLSNQTHAAVERAKASLHSLRELVTSRWSTRQATVLFDDAESSPLAVTDERRGMISLNVARANQMAERLNSRCTKVLAPKGKRWSLDDWVIYLVAHEYGHLVEDDVRFCGRDFGGARTDELRADAVAGWLCGRLNLDGHVGALAAGSLGCEVATCNYPTSEERSLAYWTGHLGALSEPATPTMNLVVLRATDLERAREFYGRLGLQFRAEQHGSGPKHYSCAVNGGIMELYPCSARTTGVRLGLRVVAPSRAIDDLIAHGFVPQRPKLQERRSSPSVYVIKDPDGNTVELEAG